MTQAINQDSPQITEQQKEIIEEVIINSLKKQKMDNQHLQFILKQLKQSLQKLYGKNLIDVILFGSYAKNIAHQNSDVDILIILDNEFDLDVEIAKTSHIIANLCLEHDLLISRLFMSQNYYTTHQSALVRNIHNEGIKI